MNQPDLKTSSSSQPFEDALTRALAHVAPPHGFAERVLVRAAAATPAAEPVLHLTASRWRAAYALAAMLLIALLVSGVLVERKHQQRAREQAQFDTAVAVTHRALNHTRAQLARAGIDLNQ